ncbi:MAG TPA: TolC family protein [Bryobacteraceae bacterium]|jgi:outer membrane protein TolC|nr:TolC family protein [Bryobacteraceae bacterium]
MKNILALLLASLMAAPSPAQTPATPASPDRTPVVTMNTGLFRGEYQPGSVSEPDLKDSTRIDGLVRAGNIYLSLQDAIALALENNLDLELERYGLRMAATDVYRAEGGGFLRGVPLTVNETPAGIGGPAGSPLLTTAASGSIAQGQISSAVTDTQLIAEGSTSLAITGPFGFASGPPLPFFDPFVNAQLGVEHATATESGLASTGAPFLYTNSLFGNATYNQGFSLGTQVTAGFQAARTNQNLLTNIFSPYDTSTLGVTVTQPLFRGFGRELNRRFIHIARNSEKISDYVFQQQIISTISGVIRLYDDLVSLVEDSKVKQETLATAQRLLEDNRNKVEEGTLAPIEATRAEAQVAAAQQDLINSQGYVRQQELILKNVLSRNWGDDPLVHEARIVPTDTLTLEPLPLQPASEIVAQAFANRPELSAAKLELTNTQINLQGTKNELLPEIDLVGTISGSGIAGPPNPALPLSGAPGVNGGFGTTLDQILKRDYPTYSVGVNLTLPVRNRVAQSDVARDELQVRQTQLRLKQLQNQIRTEVEDALIALQRTRSAYDAALQTAKLQEQSLAIEQEKFGVGLSTNFLVIQYQGYLAQARSTAVAALDAYAKAKVQFERAAGLTLNNHNISVDEAIKGRVTR